MRIFPKNKKSESGFTIVELLVAMSIFVIILTIAVGVFVSALRNQRLLTEQMAVNNNAALVLEQMAREMRTGYNFPPAIGACSDSITFTNSQKGDNATYALLAGGITRTEGGVTKTLTASDVVVKNLCFRVFQYSGSGAKQECSPPRVLIAMEVGIKNTSSKAQSTHLETVVSSRILPAEIQNDPYSCRIR